MSITSGSGLMSNYSRLSNEGSSLDEEKNLHMGLQQDVEAGDRPNGEKKSNRFIDGRTVSDARIIRAGRYQSCGLWWHGRAYCGSDLHGLGWILGSQERRVCTPQLNINDNKEDRSTDSL